jgi:hypothetical protein
MGMLRRLYPCVIKKKDFQPSTSKNISTLRVEKYQPAGRLDSTGMLRRPYPRVIKKKDFQPSTSKNISTLRVEKYQPAGRLTDSTGDAVSRVIKKRISNHPPARIFRP